MEIEMKKKGVDLEQINAFYAVVKPTFANCLLFLITFWKPPQFIWKQLLKGVKPFAEKQKLYPRLLFFVRMIYLFKKGSRTIISKTQNQLFTSVSEKIINFKKTPFG